MTRPYMQLGVGQLEALFEKSAGDDKVLKKLEHELQFRQVPRAIVLLEKVVAAQRNLVQPQRQPETADAATNLSSRSPVQVSLLPHAEKQRDASSAPSGVASFAASSDSSVSLTQAQSLLDAPGGTPWEAIEKRRRDLVEKSNPLASLREQHRPQALENAARVNAAYRLLLRVRCDVPS